MTFEQFAYWLQGFAEINGREPSTAEWKMIKEHLATCFIKVTPRKDGIEKWLDLNKDRWEIPSITCTGVNPLTNKPHTIC